MQRRIDVRQSFRKTNLRTTASKVAVKKAVVGKPAPIKAPEIRIDVKQKFSQARIGTRADYIDYPSGLGNKSGIIPQTGTSKRGAVISKGKETKRIQVKQKFAQPKVQGRGRLDYTDYPSGRGSKRGIVEQRGLARREARQNKRAVTIKERLKQKSKVGNTGFLAVVDRLFIRVNKFCSDVGF